MDEILFKKCLDKWEKKITESWDDLAKNNGLISGEVLRNRFKRERKRRGVGKEKEQSKIPLPRVLVFDLELSPMVVYTFDLWNQNISPSNIVKNSFLLCWSAKYLNDNNFFGGCMTPKEAKEGDDRRIVYELWQLLNTADIVIGQNIRDFDLKKLNVRLLHHKMKPVNKFSIIDTYQIAKNSFSFPSNSLRYMNKFLGISQKLDNDGFKLWENCVNGDKLSLDKMLEYCKGDVIATEDLYYELRPFIKNHPNMAVFNETNEEMCPNCGSINIELENYRYTNNAKYESMRCADCGAISRKKKNILPKEKRKVLLTT